MRGNHARRGLHAVFRAAALVALLAPPAAAQPAFRVNETTADVQAAPEVAALADDSIIVVWESGGQDGDDLGIFARRVGGGVPNGSEFQVNVYTTGVQQAPRVAALAGGGFAVVWESYDLIGGEDVLTARRFESSAAPLGSEFHIGEAISQYHVAPDIAADASGRFVIVWDDFDDVFGQLFDATGAPLGSEFAVNSETAGYQCSAAVAMQADGGFVVAWVDGSYYGDGMDGDGYGVFARRFASDGAPLGTDFQVNTETLGGQYAPDVAAAPDGELVVVWESYGGEKPDGIVAARRFDAAAQPLGSEFAVSDPAAYYPNSPRVAARADSFAVVWSDVVESFDTALARRFDSDATPRESPFVIDPQSMVQQTRPVVAAQASGALAAVWESGDGDETGVFMRLIGAETASPTATSMPATATPMRTPSPTPTRTASITPSRTPTPSFTASATASRTPTPTPTGTLTATATRTASATPTRTPTATPSATRTHTETPTGTRSPSATPTRTFTATASGTATQTATRTRTATATQTATRTRTATATYTAPRTATAATTPIETAVTATPTGSFAATDTPLAVPPAPQTSPTAAICSGDCDGDDSVSISELIAAVNIALGRSEIARCAAVDGNSDGAVSIGELILAVDRALHGC